MAKKIKCPKCKGQGFYTVDYSLTREETHARCEDCDGKGELETENEKICTTCHGNHYIMTDKGSINCPICVCNTFFSERFTMVEKSNKL